VAPVVPVFFPSSAAGDFAMWKSRQRWAAGGVLLVVVGAFGVYRAPDVHLWMAIQRTESVVVRVNALPNAVKYFRLTPAESKVLLDAITERTSRPELLTPAVNQTVVVFLIDRDGECFAEINLWPRRIGVSRQPSVVSEIVRTCSRWEGIGRHQAVHERERRSVLDRVCN
jgi:hypothetical protein